MQMYETKTVISRISFDLIIMIKASREITITYSITLQNNVF
jgi:hypothetical protein